jgi:hypothetical protein
VMVVNPSHTTACPNYEVQIFLNTWLDTPLLLLVWLKLFCKHTPMDAQCSCRYVSVVTEQNRA